MKLNNFIVVGLLGVGIARGDPAPIGDINNANATEAQRLNRLEQQMNNLTQMNLPQQVSDLQQQIAVLRGQLQVAQHDLQGLDSRITVTAGNTSATSSTPNNTPNIPPTTNNPTTNNKDTETYQTAFRFLENKQYDKAQAVLKTYLHDFPKGQYSVNVHYWLGEIYFSQKHNELATQEFKTVVDQFPQSPKVPDAQLKLAMIRQIAGDNATARALLSQIIQQYPGTTSAQLANIRLQQIHDKN